MNEVVYVQGLTKSYGDKTVINHLNLSVRSGTVFGLLGANGAGKSTTIECILGTKQPDSGTVRLLGKSPMTHRRKLFQRVGGLMGLPQAIACLRERKVLKRFRVTPVRPVFIIGVELAMYIVYCIASLATLLVTALLWKVRLHGSLTAFLGSWLITMLSTLSVGIAVGGVAKDTKQTSVIASVLYFPMLIFSGTTLPVEVMPNVMRRIVSVFPLTQGIAMMKNAFLGIDMGNILLPISVMLGLTVLCAGLAVRFFRWE